MNTDKQTIYIYGLYTDSEDDIRYVGKTQDLEKRLRAHINNSKYRNTHKDKWIRKVLKENKEIKMRIIDICDEDNWSEKEIYWISYYKNINNLTNLAKGGFGGKFSVYTKTYEE